MQIKHTKTGTKIRLSAMPTEDVLKELNSFCVGEFILCTKRGYPRLLHKTTVTMECPIKQWFTL